MKKNSSHILPPSEIPIEIWLSNDPELALVHADMNEWADAHPCTCETLCECDKNDEKQESRDNVIKTEMRWM